MHRKRSLPVVPLASRFDGASGLVPTRSNTEMIQNIASVVSSTSDECPTPPGMYTIGHVVANDENGEIYDNVGFCSRVLLTVSAKYVYFI